MYGYDIVIEALQEKLKTLTDPKDTSENPKPITTSVEFGQEELKSLYGAEVKFIILFSDTDKIGSQGMRGQSKQVVIEGAVVTLIPGDNSAAAIKCYRCSDIVEDFLENENCLDLPGCIVEVPDDGAQNWTVVDVSGNPRGNNRPNKATAAATKFKITKRKEPQF